MPLITLKDVSVSFGAEPVLDHADFSLARGERICLLGRNGAGKSTLMKLINRELVADSGEISRKRGLVIGRLDQEVESSLSGCVHDVVADGVDQLGDLLKEYQHLSRQLETGDSPRDMAALADVQHRLEAAGGWHLQARVQTVLSRLELTGEQPFATLSGGRKRRVLLARALVAQPELLLLDEPTNHLDLDSILWLEDFLLDYPGTLLFVTHDRAFLRRLATRIVELDRGRLRSWPGDYDQWLQRREQALASEVTENARFDRKLANEEIWSRQGIKARRTRNEGRVRALQAMRDQRSARRQQAGRVEAGLNTAEASGRRVIAAHSIGYRYGDQVLFADFSCTILRGDKVGIIGPNGCGKTTLLQILLGERPPQQGQLELGTRLQIGYFDQFRSHLDPRRSVLDNLTDGASSITVNGRSRHVMSYLQDFLFEPDKARAPVSTLSGGERNRLMLARLFATPTNLLVLDEPTNDLDLETLELLEQLLVEYSGTLLLVSHDRWFLDNVITSSLVFGEDGGLREYVGGYSDYLKQRPTVSSAMPRTPCPPATTRGEPRTRQRLSYREQRELDRLPQQIEVLEARQSALQQQLSDPNLYRQHSERVAELKQELETSELVLEQAYQRWEILEAGGASDS